MSLDVSSRARCYIRFWGEEGREGALLVDLNSDYSLFLFLMYEMLDIEFGERLLFSE